MTKSTILIVDDEPINIEIIANILNDEYDLKAATSGKAAIELLSKVDADLILLDISMPEMDGYETCSILKENPKTRDIPIIFITAKSDDGSIEKAYDAGGSDYIPKPLKPKELLSRVRKELKLSSLIKNLETRVQSQVDDIRKQDYIIQYQSKFALLGEMLNMIAHQWRQPLNAISASSIKLALFNELDSVDKILIETTNDFIQNQTQHMSQIIEDFMGFNKPESNKEYFLYESVKKALQIIEPQLKNKSISLKINVDENIKIFHNSKEIEHILLNLINNARDAFEDKEMDNKTIKIYTTKSEDSVILHVEDNAGGIPEEIIDKIFDLYVTTKAKGKGTGIGLYMSKQMAESVAGSSLKVSNVENGARFDIIFNRLNEETGN